MKDSTLALIGEILEKSGLRSKYKEKIIAAAEAVCKAS